MRKPTAILTVLLSACIPSFAWGPEGHRVIAEVAEHHLNTAARRQVRELLGNDDLAAVSTWADDIKERRPETRGWHFVDIPWDAAGFSEPRDCFHPVLGLAATATDHSNCVVDRIVIFQQVLADRRKSRAERAEALKFLVHFVGDVHQPLHAVVEARGGNEIHVTEFDRSKCGNSPCNLHAAWDTGLIEHALRLGAPPFGPLNYPLLLENVIEVRNLRARPQGSPEQWANESFRLAHEIWLPDGGAVDEAYYRKNIGVLDERLALAGLRLAALLNQALGSSRSGISDLAAPARREPD